MLKLVYITVTLFSVTGTKGGGCLFSTSRCCMCWP